MIECFNWILIIIIDFRYDAHWWEQQGNLIIDHKMS